MSKLQLVSKSMLLFRKTAENVHVSTKAKANPTDSLVCSEGRQQVHTAGSD